MPALNPPSLDPPPTGLQRRQLVLAMASVSLLTLQPCTALSAAGTLVRNVTDLYSVMVARIERPSNAAEVSKALRAWPGKVAIGGGHFSMGGQVAIEGGLQLDMRQMSGLVWLRPELRRARVQAGMRWRDLQELLDPLDLAVKTMQSYANFTIGGSVSVNCHGRYVGHGPVGNSVQALQLVLADGEVLECSRSERSELFKAAIGGYGAVGVITEVELDLAQNVRIERFVEEFALPDYLDHFQHHVLGRADSVLHNADLMPPHFDRPVSVTWRRSDKALTETARLVPRNARYGREQSLIWAMTELPGGAQLRRSIVHPLLTAKPAVQWLNHEASLDVAELEPRTRRMSTYVLQEFFIPTRHFLGFAKGMARVLRAHEVMALNVSIRHAPADTLSQLPWAREEVFCFVLYFKQRKHAAALAAVGRWTRELIDLCLAHDGRYYLPYQPHASRTQFERAYPEILAFRQIKNAADPSGKLSNQLWAKYL